MSRRLAALAATTAVLIGTSAAAADPGTTTRDGKTLTVSKADGLRVDGERVRVRGSGYDRSKGIYVAFCVDNGPGKMPSPCGGGADTEGSSGNSVWISSFPPAYGTGLAQPYGDGGAFDVEISVRALLRTDDPETEQDETVDCRTARCAVVTRNDHTRSDDRSQDVAVPIAFAGASRGSPAAAPTAPAVSAPAAAPSRAVGSGPTATRPTSPGTATASTPAIAAPSDTVPASASAAPAPAVADDEKPVAAADPVSVPAAVAEDGSLLLPLLLAGALVAGGLAGAVAWRRRAGDPGDA